MADIAGAEKTRALDLDLRRRAAAVIPGGMFGHMSVNRLPDAYPQFYERRKGRRLWDVDGNEYVDFMCSYGPIDPRLRAPGGGGGGAAQAAIGDCRTAPAACMVELAELLVERCAHADWAIFAKNGTDATTTADDRPRAQTGRSKILVATGAYHGAAPWCTLRPAASRRRSGRNSITTPTTTSRASSARSPRPVTTSPAIIASPFRHDAGFDQETSIPRSRAVARAVRRPRCRARSSTRSAPGFRLNHGGSWEPLGVEPDLSAWSKGIANGYPTRRGAREGRDPRRRASRSSSPARSGARRCRWRRRWRRSMPCATRTRSR